MPKRTAAVILAGGASRRMGSDKALLMLPDGRTALAHVLEAARAVADPVLLSVASAAHGARLAAAAPLPPAAVLLDRDPGAGPLAALAGAMAVAGTDALFALAVDTPLVSPLVLQALQQALYAEEVDAVVPLLEGAVQPLPAIYATTLAPQAERLLAENRQSLKALLLQAGTRVRYMEEAELRALDPELRTFSSANTPAEWQLLLRQARAADHAGY